MTTPASEVRRPSASSRRLARTSVVLACVFLAGPTNAQDGGLAIAVSSATLHPADPPLEPVNVGPGVYLPEDLAIRLANERRQPHAEPVPGPTSGTIIISLIAGVVLGGVVGFAVGFTNRRP